MKQTVFKSRRVPAAPIATAAPASYAGWPSTAARSSETGKSVWTG
jgi:hypothetical protein